MNTLDDKIAGIDMVLLRLKIGVFEDVCDRFGKALSSPDDILGFAAQITNWLCAPVASLDVAETVAALDGLYCDIDDRVNALTDAVAKLEQNAAVSGAPVIETGAGAAAPESFGGTEGRAPIVSTRKEESNPPAPEAHTYGTEPVVEPGPQDSIPPEISDGGQHVDSDAITASQEATQSTTPAPAETPAAPGTVEMPKPGLQKHTAIGGAPLTPVPVDEPAEASLRSRFWQLIVDAGKDGTTYSACYKPLDLHPSFNTQLSAYVNAWKAEGKVVVRFDGSSNHKRFWLTGFAPTEPEAPRPMSQRERVMAHLTEAAANGATFGDIVKACDIPSASLQSLFSILGRDGLTEFEFQGNSVGDRRYFLNEFRASPVAAPPLEPTPVPVPAPAVVADPEAEVSALQQNNVEDADILAFLRKQGKIGAPAVDICKHLRARPADVLEALKEFAREIKVKATPSANGLKWFHADFAQHLPSYTPPPAPAAVKKAVVSPAANQTIKCDCTREFRPEFPSQTKCNICRSKFSATIPAAI